jgi:outer membrane immunogenic protein
MFKYGLLAAVAIIGGTSVALSADMPVKAPAPVVVSDSYNWSGFYVGAFVGGVWGETNAFPAAGGPNPIKVEASGLVAGVHAGYDIHMSNNVVVGFQVAAPFGVSVDQTVPDPVFPATVSIKGELEWAVLFTGHVGLAMGRWLPYIGGGFALAEAKATFVSPGLGTNSDTRTHTGFTALAGLRYGFSPNWWGAIQYNYTDLGSETYAPVPAAGAAGTRTVDLSSHSVVGMISYRWGGPVVARY